MSKNELLIEVSSSSEPSHQNPSKFCFLLLFSLLLAAVMSDELNGLETQWGLPSVLLLLLCKTLNFLKSFGKKTVQDASLQSMVQTPFDLRENESNPKGTISLYFMTALAVDYTTFFLLWQVSCKSIQIASIM